MNTTIGEFRRGWRVVLGAAIGAGFGLTGLPFYTLGLFLKPLSAEFGWSRAQVSGAALCLTLGSVVAAPLIGRFVDRVDVRWIGLGSLGALAFGYLCLGWVIHDIVSFYVALSVLAIAACGTTPIVWTRIVTVWFDTSRGLALALTLVGTGLAAILGPLLTSTIIQSGGWRWGYVGLGVATALIAIPLIALLLPRTLPLGLKRHADAVGMAPRDAFRSQPFWLIALAFFLLSMGIAAAIVHLVPLLTDAGMAPVLAARLAGLMGFSIIVGRLAVGALLDRFPAKYVACAFFLVPASGCLLLANADGSVALASIAALGFGLSAGAEVDLIAFLTSRYFGLKSYGEIYSWQLVAFSLGAGTGPLAAGSAYDAYHTYHAALYAGAAMFTAAILLLSALGPYRFGRSGA